MRACLRPRRMPKSLLEQLPEIVAQGRKEAEKILESIESRHRVSLQTREVVLPAKDAAATDWIIAQARADRREVFAPGQGSLLATAQPMLGTAQAEAPWANRLIYGDNLLAMAAASAVLDAVANEPFLAEVRAKGERLRSRLEQFIGNYPELFEEVRGKGLMLGLKMKVEPRAFMQHLRDRHQLLTVAAGDSTVRVLPPLVIGDAEIEEFFDKLSAGAADFQPPEPA